MDFAIACFLIFGSVGAGFAWGRISSHLPIPEVFRLLMTPLWTGTLAVLLGWCVSVVRLDWITPRLADAANLGVASVARLTSNAAIDTR
jgi:hypothetical protein